MREHSGRKSTLIRTLTVAALPLLLVAGCATPENAATKADIDALRSEIGQLRSEIGAATSRSETAAQRADQAATAAQAAAAEAAAASEKADRIYRQSLRK